MSFRLQKIQMPNINADARRLFDDGDNNRNSTVHTLKQQQQQQQRLNEQEQEQKQQQHDMIYFDSIEKDLDEALGNHSVDPKSFTKTSMPINPNLSLAEDEDEEYSFAELNNENLDEIFNKHPKNQATKTTTKKDNSRSLSNTPLRHSLTNNQHKGDSPPSISINNEYGDLFIDQQEFEPNSKTAIEIHARKSLPNISQKSNLVTQPKFRKEKPEPHMTTPATGDDDELMVLEVQKFPSLSSTKQLKKSELGVSKSSNRFSLTKTKYSGTVGKGSHSSSDKFLDPLLASISKIQMEKNAIQSEYSVLNIKYSKANTQLEKTLGAVAALKRHVDVLVNVQNELQNDLRNIRNGPYSQIPIQLKELKSDSSSIDEAIKELGNALSSTRLTHDKLTSKLSDIKVTQSHCILCLILKSPFST